MDSAKEWVDACSNVVDSFMKKLPCNELLQAHRQGEFEGVRSNPLFDLQKI